MVKIDQSHRPSSITSAHFGFHMSTERLWETLEGDRSFECFCEAVRFSRRYLCLPRYSRRYIHYIIKISFTIFYGLHSFFIHLMKENLNSSWRHDSWSVTKPNSYGELRDDWYNYLHLDWYWPMRVCATMSAGQWEAGPMSRDGHAGHARTGNVSTRHRTHISGLKTLALLHFYC